MKLKRFYNERVDGGPKQLRNEDYNFNSSLKFNKQYGLLSNENLLENLQMSSNYRKDNKKQLN